MSKGRPLRALVGAALPTVEHHFTVLQIAGAHQFSTAAVVKMIESGEVRGRKFGKEWRVSEAAYRKWLRDSEIQPAEAKP